MDKKIKEIGMNQMDLFDCTRKKRAQLDIPTGMMMGMDTQQAMLMEMNSGGGMGGGTGGGMGTDMGWGMGGGGGGGGGRRGGGNGGGNGGGMSDMMGGGGGGSGGNMDTMGSGGGGNMENMNSGGGGLPGNGMTGRQQNMGRFSMGGGGGGGGGGNANNNNMGGNSAMMTMMLCRETPSRFGEMPCNVNNPNSCPMSQYLSCKSGVYFYPVCCAKDWRSLRIVDVMF